MEINESEKKVLDIMENPRGISRKEIESLTKEEWEDCCLLDELSMALEEKHILNKYPVDKELDLFSRKRRRAVVKKWMVWGMAACITALAFMGGFYWFGLDFPTAIQPKEKDLLTEYLVIQADTMPQEVRLEVEDEQQHHSYCVARVENISAMEPEVVCVDNEISYQKEYGLNEGDISPKKSVVKKHTLSIPSGQMYKLILSDGTEVHLNAGSRLMYPTKFVRKERIVTLEGEAYFKVAKDADRPFIVNAGGIQTHVLGTEFNINSYSSDVHITLIEGSVRVEAKGNTRVMTPGQELCVRKDGDMSVKDIDLQSYVYWRDGYFYYDNLPLVEVVKNIARWYNLGVEFRNVEAMNCKVHFQSHRYLELDKTITLLNRMEKAFIHVEGRTIIVE